ncbi:MAG: STAS domain-containing protein [Gammaproteobacteria bacterium]|jgi:anti-sigma B factor antagonist|nr:STAS domain-containing protein [Gammaproteobacteria bacterium]MBU0770754.1 STAS domain-containing protein [Gammaproteobacteria bacterium]MBU0856833.1 STAS domain-containing protein [Gammaproteobacteria bacterium]MBU1847590.1 STAS domain-containing protein [Gammaproteobacteria bacterium]
MNIDRKDEAGGPIELSVQGELTIFGAADAYGVLTRVLSEKRDLRVNLSRVSELDSSGVQLLLAAKNAAQRHGQRFELVAHSPAVLDVMDLLQLGPVFGDPVVVPA